MSVKRPFTREQRTTIVYGMLAFVLILVVLQLWLLTATMNAYLGGDESVIWPAAIASVVCLLLNVGLLRYLYYIERDASMSAGAAAAVHRRPPSRRCTRRTSPWSWRPGSSRSPRTSWSGARSRRRSSGSNVAFYVALWLLTAARLLRYPDRVAADFMHHGRAVGFFTTVAATCVLGHPVR